MSKNVAKIVKLEATIVGTDTAKHERTLRQIDATLATLSTAETIEYWQQRAKSATTLREHERCERAIQIAHLCA